jgi:RNA polymerase sigma-70 factor (ECF subfamily)
MSDGPAASDGGAADFEPHRRRLAGLAYRMLGSVADAQDVVQDAWLRWRTVDRTTVDDPRAFLARIVTRLCLDRLKSARAQREIYVGPWLPEPVMDEGTFGMEPGAEAALDLSAALMLALERLSPLERAAFLMHDVFDASFEEVGAAIGRPAATCRQLALRARRHVQAARPRFAVSADEGERIAAAFRDAAAAGDATARRPGAEVARAGPHLPRPHRRAARLRHAAGRRNAADDGAGDRRRRHRRRPHRAQPGQAAPRDASRLDGRDGR